jgi:urease accessory protein
MTMLREGEAVGEAVGRIGELAMTFARRGPQTVLAESYSRSPWHCFPPAALTDGEAYAFLVATPSANRIYRTLSEPAEQTVHVTVSAGARLEWVPEATIPFAGSRFHQMIDVRLEAGATVLLWDALASGRIARGERWAFAGLDNEIRITTAGGAALLERYRLPAGRGAGQAGLLDHWDYAASFFAVGDQVSSQTWKRLEEDWAGLLDQRGDALGGVSATAAPGLAVKLLARNAPALQDKLLALWTAARRHLWNQALPALRRYGRA